MTLLFGHDKTVADWASKRTGASLRAWHHAVGVLDREGGLIGAASFHDMNGANVELCFHGPGAVSAAVVRELARFVFDGLGVTRVTARTPRGNKIVTRHLPRWGFKYEGTLRRYYGNAKRLDAILFGLIREDAGWLLGDPS